MCVCVCLTGKSDPYVKVKLGTEQEVKTKHKKGNLNPRFNQTFDLLVYEPSVEVGSLCGDLCVLIFTLLPSYVN